LDIVEYWDAIEADFQSVYNIDLLTTNMSWRRFITLLKNLPPNTAVIRRLKQEREGRQTNIDEIDEKKASENFFRELGV